MIEQMTELEAIIYAADFSEINVYVDCFGAIRRKQGDAEFNPFNNDLDAFDVQVGGALDIVIDGNSLSVMYIDQFCGVNVSEKSIDFIYEYDIECKKSIMRTLITNVAANACCATRDGGIEKGAREKIKEKALRNY